MKWETELWSQKNNECYNILLTAFYLSAYDFVFFQVLTLDTMMNFVSICRIFLAKTENTVSRFHHKRVEVEAHMAFIAVFKQQYRKTLSKKRTVLQAHH